MPLPYGVYQTPLPSGESTIILPYKSYFALKGEVLLSQISWASPSISKALAPAKSMKPCMSVF